MVLARRAQCKIKSVRMLYMRSRDVEVLMPRKKTSSILGFISWLATRRSRLVGQNTVVGHGCARSLMVDGGRWTVTASSWRCRSRGAGLPDKRWPRLSAFCTGTPGHACKQFQRICGLLIAYCLLPVEDRGHGYTDEEKRRGALARLDAESGMPQICRMSYVVIVSCMRSEIGGI